MPSEGQGSQGSCRPAHRRAEGVHTYHEDLIRARGGSGQGFWQVLEPHQVGGPRAPFLAGLLPDKVTGSGNLTVGPSGMTLTYWPASGAASEIPIVNGALEGSRWGGAPPLFSPEGRSQVFGEISAAPHQLRIGGQVFLPNRANTLNQRMVAF